MNTSKEDISKASKQADLTDFQAESLWQALQAVQAKKSAFNFSTALLYLGAFIAILSMTWFYTAHLNSRSSLLISIAYAMTFFGTGTYFWWVKNLRNPGGLLFSLGIVMVPLIVYSLQKFLNWWPPSSPSGYTGFYYWIQGKWVPMEMCTLLVACLVLYFIRFSFITVLIYSVVWFTSMDIVHLFEGTNEGFFKPYSIVSIAIGTLLNILGFSLCRKNQRDFGFWSYFFGMLLCWAGLAIWDIETEWGYFAYFLIHCAFLLLSGFFHRRIFLFFGSLGIVFYIGHLARIFSDSLMFSYVLAAIGFCVILLAAFLIRSRKKRQMGKCEA